MARAHLLVVDDEPSILTTLQKALSLEGYGVDVAGGVKVAEEKLKKRTYDLCLFDVMLPDGDGVELLQRMRAGKVDTPVIMMSGHATIDTAVRAVRARGARRGPHEGDRRGGHRPTNPRPVPHRSPLPIRPARD